MNQTEIPNALVHMEDQLCRIANADPACAEALSLSTLDTKAYVHLCVRMILGSIMDANTNKTDCLAFIGLTLKHS